MEDELELIDPDHPDAHEAAIAACSSSTTVVRTERRSSSKVYDFYSVMAIRLGR